MRIGSSAVAVVLLLFSTACGDLGTLPAPERVGAPSLSGDCVPSEGGGYICPPLVGGGGGVGCDPYHYDCGGDDCISSLPEGFVGTQSCPGLGGGGPGGSPGGDGSWSGGGGGGNGAIPPACPDYDPDCEAELPPDTCVTDDPVINDRMVEAAFAGLWKDSNPDAPQAERVEQAAWIVQTEHGLQIVRWTNATFGPCTITPHLGSFGIPPDAIGWIHTHPFTVGEVQTSCEPVRHSQDGAPTYGAYSSFPNQDDIQLAGLINEALGRNIPAYTIDQSTVNRFVATSTITVSEYSLYGRCGY